jgi:NADH-ubiquinone oxidoreductase chain 2
MGIPPLLGFFAKQLVLSAALANGYYFLTLIAVLTSVIGGVYYLMLIVGVFFSKSDYVRDDNLAGKVSFSSSLSVTISILTLINAMFILYPQGLLSIANILALTH